MHVLKVVSQNIDEDDLDDLWQSYRQQALFEPVTNEKLVLHPVIRSFLLQRLSQRNDEGSKYYRLHKHVREYFSKRAAGGDSQAAIEEAYHALALGDAKPAITLMLTALQKEDVVLWKQMYEAYNLALSAGKSNLRPEDIQLALTMITGSQALQGASGQISFDSKNDPIQKVAIIVSVHPDNTSYLDIIDGCLIKGCK